MCYYENSIVYYNRLIYYEQSIQITISRGKSSMKKTVKNLLLLFLCILCAFSIFSCKKKKPGSGSGGNDQGSQETAVEKVVYSPTVNATLVLGEGVGARSVSLIRSTYAEAVGKNIEVVSASAAEASHEIIIGKTSRALSQKAYRALELAEHEEGEVGYVIYSDGSSVALAFDEASFGEEVALATAIDDFVAICMKGSTLKLDSGVVYYTNFDPMEKQTERDDKTLELLWNLKLSHITEKVGGDEAVAESIVSALKKLYAVYNKDHSTVKWIADLYDPEIGGFYYSNSARNNVGYLPDLESTSEALSLIELMLSGYGGTLTDYLGEEIADKFVSFAKNMQNPNGYFYHPQWTKENVDKNLEKRSRDVVNALAILDFFGAQPTYDTPNGRKGEGTAAPASLMTKPLSMNGASSVAQLVSAESEEIYIPSHLKTKDSFEKYLSGLNIKSNTKSVSEAIYAEVPLYVAIDEMLEEEGASYRLTDILKQYLKNNQNASIGLWISSTGDRNAAIGSVQSVIKIYNALGSPVSDYMVLLNTITSAIKSLDNPEKITDVTDLWASFYSVVSNVKTYSDEGSIENISLYLAQIYEDFESLINKTIENISLFSDVSGSFTANAEAGTGDMMGMLVAVPGVDEGDIGSTLLATKNLWLSIFGALEIGCVPIFNASDRMTFQKTFLDLGIIIKNDVQKVEPVDFESYDVGDTPTIRHQFYSADSKMEIVYDSSRESNAARLYSDKNKGANFDFYYFDVMSKVNSASCYSYELDMCVLPETSSGAFAQLYLFRDMHIITLDRDGDTVRFYENSSRTASATRTMDVGVTAEIGEWFKLRVEYYPTSTSTARIKIYFNDECVVVSDNFFGSQKANATVPTSFTSFCIYGYHKMNMDVLVDNVAVETTYAAYTVETGSLNRNVDYPDKAQSIHGFEGNTVGNAPSAFKPSGAADSAVVKNDSDGNKLLFVTEGIGEIVLPLDSRGSGINSALVELDFTLSSNSKSGAAYQICFNEYKYDNSMFGSMFIVIKEENGTKYATVADGVAGKLGDTYDNVKMYVGEKHRIGFHLFYGERAIVVTVDGTVVGINSDVAEVNRYYLGEIKLVSFTPSIDSEILIDNVISEKIASDFEKATAPSVDRVVGSFDSADGMEFSGVYPSGGVLSFESASGNAYVKMPVNTRVNSPNLALIGLDVSVDTSASGEMYIRLSDKSGNILATFVLESKNGETAIYEYTENGKYVTPIYTFSKPSFKLTFEYSISGGDFNVLIDGLYVAATSVTHSLDSTAYSFDYLTIGCNGAVGFTVDNVYAEELFGVFASHGVATPNLDPVDGKFTFETSSFASMPTQIERILGDSISYHKIKEANVNGAVSKVLEMHLGTGKNATYSIFQKTHTKTGSNAVFFETDVMLKRTTTDVTVFFELQSSARGALSISIGDTGEGTYLSLLGKELKVKAGEWFKLRIEYRDTPHDFNYDGTNDILARIFVNGELVAETNTAANSTIVKSSEISKMRIRNTSGRTGIVYLDNAILGECSMSYTPPAPPDTDTLTYEPGMVTNMTKPSFEKSTSKLSISSLDVAGNITKVLDFYTSAGSYDTVTVSTTLTEKGANAVMLETELMINPESDTATFNLTPFTPKGNTPVTFTLVAEKGGDVKLYSKDSAGKNDPAAPEGVTLGRSGEWIKLRIEYMNPRLDYTLDGTDDILCRIYADGVLLRTFYKPYASGAYYDPAVISRLVISAEKESVATLYLDNTRFWQTKLTPDEAPEPEKDIVLGENGSSEGKFDPNGWL